MALKGRRGVDQMQELALYVILGLSGFAMAIFFILRCIVKFKKWRDGDKNELWPFIALLIGAVPIFILAVALVFPMSFGEGILGDAGDILITLCLAPIGLYTYYYILKWLEAK